MFYGAATDSFARVRIIAYVGETFFATYTERLSVPVTRREKAGDERGQPEEPFRVSSNQGALTTRRALASYPVVIARIALTLLLATTFCVAATQGIFRGKIVRGPASESGSRWLYIQNHKGAIRRVEISGARISYAPEVSKKDRAAIPEDSLREGVQVQVIASQDDSGEWKATAVTILAVGDSSSAAATTRLCFESATPSVL